MEETYVGYHGTTKEAAISIISMNKFLPNEENKNNLYLGKGIYFYIVYEDAVAWNTGNYIKMHKKKPNNSQLNTEYDVLKSNITVIKENVLDLDEAKDLKAFDEIVKSIKGKMITKEEYIKARNKNGAIINYLTKVKVLEGIDIIFRTIKDPINIIETHKFNDFYRRVMCVKNENIIKTINIEEKVQDDVFEIVAYFY